jgi:O-antigen ligase
MNARQAALRREVPFDRSRSLEAPPAVLEGAYYAYLAYASLAPEFGLVIPLAGLASLMVLTAFFVLRRGATIGAVLHSIRLPLACAVSFVGVRMLVHGESLGADYIRDTPAWVCTLVIAHSLGLRPGFLQRLPLAMFVIGLPALRSLRLADWGATTSAGEAVVRAAGSGPLSNSNAMAFWFGFCAIYFAVLGLETRRMSLRLAAWTAAVACLFVIGLTVSRGTLLAVAIAVVIAFRRLMKRSVLPLVLLMVAAWSVYRLGIFDRAAGYYSARGLEETGRLLVWPLVVERFLTSPWFGVSNIGTYIPGRVTSVTPHNLFLFVALSSGLVPLLLFVAYCARSAIGVWRAHRSQHPDDLFVLPFFVYIFLFAQSSNALYLDFPFIVTFAAALVAAETRKAPAVALRSPRGLRRDPRQFSTPGRLAQAPLGHHSR